MKPITLFTAALLAGGPIALLASATPFGSEGGTDSTAIVSVVDSEYESLAAEFVEAEKTFKDKLKAATKAERKELRKNAPITQYWPRFTEMARKGEGRAMLWLIDHVRDNRDIRSKERGKVMTPLFEGLFADHVNADWFDGAISALATHTRSLGVETAHGLFVKGIEAAKSDDRTAALLWHASATIEETMPKEAAAYRERILEEFGNTMYGTAVAAANAKPEDSEVGKIAPNFVGKTIDGFQFSLEDYRGKVVLLDFYGFW